MSCWGSRSSSCLCTRCVGVSVVFRTDWWLFQPLAMWNLLGVSAQPRAWVQFLWLRGRCELLAHLQRHLRTLLLCFLFQKAGFMVIIVLTQGLQDQCVQPLIIGDIDFISGFQEPVYWMQSASHAFHRCFSKFKISQKYYLQNEIKAKV